MSCPKPVDKFIGYIHREGTAILDGRTDRTIECDMSACIASCVKLYCECIEAVQPGPVVLVKPADPPNESQYVGGNATSKGN